MPEPPTHILVWLPSPMGDVIMCTPALKALRRRFPQDDITFFGNKVARDILSPCIDTNAWLDQGTQGLWAQATQLRKKKFSHAVLFKNSLGSALTCWLAGIPIRVGYVREGRGFLLTEKLQPPRRSDGHYQARPMIDYYLAVAAWLGAEVSDRSMSLSLETVCTTSLSEKLPALNQRTSPLVVLVPGGAFGPSKCWPPERFAHVAEWLTQTYQATVVLSVAPTPAEQKIAGAIRQVSSVPLIDLSQTVLSLGELKALYAQAALVIANDTGPRHMAVALRRPVITLFGPNDPAWTQTGWHQETQIIGQAPCVPCQQPTCRMDRHLCMESITVEQVQTAAQAYLA